MYGGVDGRGVPGVVYGWVGTREGYTGYYPADQIEAYLIEYEV